MGLHELVGQQLALGGHDRLTAAVAFVNEATVRLGVANVAQLLGRALLQVDVAVHNSERALAGSIAYYEQRDGLVQHHHFNVAPIQAHCLPQNHLLHGGRWLLNDPVQIVFLREVRFCIYLTLLPVEAESAFLSALGITPFEFLLVRIRIFFLGFSPAISLVDVVQELPHLREICGLVVLQVLLGYVVDGVVQV